MEQAMHYLALRGQRRTQLAADIAQRFVQDRLSVQELASQVGHRPVVVRRLLDEAGIYDAGRTLVGTDEQETARNLARRYRQTGSIAALVRETGMDKRLIRRALVDAGVSLPVMRSLSQDEVERVAARYRDGESIRTLAASFGCSYGTIRTVLHAAHVQLRPRGSGREAGPAPRPPHAADPAIGLTRAANTP
jgi:hypothetical protein